MGYPLGDSTAVPCLEPDSGAVDGDRGQLEVSAAHFSRRGSAEIRAEPPGVVPGSRDWGTAVCRKPFMRAMRSPLGVAAAFVLLLAAVRFARTTNTVRRPRRADHDMQPVDVGALPPGRRVRLRQRDEQGPGLGEAVAGIEAAVNRRLGGRWWRKRVERLGVEG